RVKCCLTNFHIVAIALSLAALAFEPFTGRNWKAHPAVAESSLAKPIRVTTLATEGSGSLREAVETPGPRLIVFEVGGVIDLAGTTLTIREPFVTIAGQTAPDPGITIIKGSIVVATHDVTIEHIASRTGTQGPKAADAMGVVRGYNVIFDHCSATWGIDENL